MAKIVTITNPLTGQPVQVDQLDHTAQQIDDGLNIARGVSNPNLLDNWYFGNPVDQRQGRIVKPNTTYYSDNQLTTAAGTTSAYVTAYRYTTGTANGVNYASFKLENKDTAPTYYAAPENVVRGYTGAGMTIDRWGQPDGHTMCFTKEGLVWNEVTDLYQGIEFTPWGEEVTFSVLTANGMVKTTFVLPESAPNEFIVVGGNTEQDVGSIGAYSQSGVYGGFWVSMFIDAGNAIQAAKLELGSQQTLAHQENGNWVLNEIPDYGEQLRRCQRYFICYKAGTFLPCVAYSEQDGWYLDAALPITGMRTPPAHNIGDGLACSVRNINAENDFMSKTIFNWGWYSGVQLLRLSGSEKTSATWPYIIRMDADLTFSADL